MPRPRKDPNQRLYAYELHQQGFGPAAIHKAVVERFEETDEPASLRTIKKWVKEFKQLGEEARAKDNPFHWHRLEEYTLPWEAGAYLVQMWSFVQEHGPFPTIPSHVEMDSGLLTATVRQARWWWQVHLAAPDISLLDAYWLAQRFSFRELTHDILGVPFEVDDLEAVLAYRPWTGPRANKRYVDAINSKRIQPVPIDEVDLADRIGDATKQTPLIGIGGELGGRLYSQTLCLLVELNREKIYTDVSDPDLFGALSGRHPTTPKVVMGNTQATKETSP
jgi:hypothetical protein